MIFDGETNYGDDLRMGFLISGAAPPEHFIDGWGGTHGYRQPAMYFPNGGSTMHGVSKPGEIVWSRIYVQNESLHMDIGRGGVVTLQRKRPNVRLDATTPQWHIMHAVTYGVSRDQMMAKHQANHIQVAYASMPRRRQMFVYQSLDGRRARNQSERLRNPHQEEALVKSSCLLLDISYHISIFTLPAKRRLLH